MNDDVTIHDLFIPGITGFSPWDPSLRGVEFVEFKRVVHDVARATKATVQNFRKADAGNNHHAAKVRLRWDGDEVFILGNQTTTFLSFSREVAPEHFVDGDEFSAQLSVLHPQWKSPPPSLLNRMPTREELALLRSVEREQVKYFGPLTLGQIVFNSFD